MKILQERESFLSNYEVSEHLKGLKKRYNWTFSSDEDKGKKNRRRFTECGPDLEVITRDTLSYLEKSPTAAVDSKDNFIHLVKFLNQFDLMKAEKLQIVNSLPRSMVILYSLVEECDQRFSEEQCDQILAKIGELFPVEEEEEEGE